MAVIVYLHHQGDRGFTSLCQVCNYCILENRCYFTNIQYRVYHAVPRYSSRLLYLEHGYSGCIYNYQQMRHPSGTENQEYICTLPTQLQILVIIFVKKDFLQLGRVSPAAASPEFGRTVLPMPKLMDTSITLTCQSAGSSCAQTEGSTCCWWAAKYRCILWPDFAGELLPYMVHKLNLAPVLQFASLLFSLDRHGENLGPVPPSSRELFIFPLSSPQNKFQNA